MAFYLDGIKTEGDSIVEKSIALVLYQFTIHSIGHAETENTAFQPKNVMAAHGRKTAENLFVFGRNNTQCLPV